MSRRLPALLLALLLGSAAWADEGDGGQAAAFLKLGAGARGQAMGNAMVAVAEDAYAVPLNPAGLLQAEGLQLGSQAGFLSDGQQSHYLAAALRTQEHAFGLAWSNSRIAQGLERRTKNTPDPEGSFTAGDDAVHLAGAAWLLPGRLSWGLGLKYLQSVIGDASAMGGSLNLGLHWRAASGLRLGAALLDPFSVLVWNTGREERAAAVLRSGAAWQPDWKGLPVPLLLSVDLDKGLEQGFKHRLGIEAEAVPRALKLRAGLDNGTWALGFGLGRALPDFAARLDYAFSGDRGGDNRLDTASHRVSLTLAFTGEIKP